MGLSALSFGCDSNEREWPRFLVITLLIWITLSIGLLFIYKERKREELNSLIRAAKSPLIQYDLRLSTLILSPSVEANWHSLTIKDYRGNTVLLIEGDSDQLTFLGRLEVPIASPPGTNAKDSVLKAGATYSLNAFFVFTLLFLAFCLTVFFFWMERNRVRKNKRLLEERELHWQREITNVALQVAHDIRSPLSALRQALSSSDFSNNKAGRLVLMASHRIESILFDLLSQNKSSIGNWSRSGESHSFYAGLEVQQNPVALRPLLSTIVDEKRAEWSTTRVKLLTEWYIENRTLIRVNETEFIRVLSNLLNNAFEAVSDVDGIIKVSVSNCTVMSVSGVNIKIADNGSGIPKHLIDKIGTKGFTTKTLDRVSGSGLGVYYAKCFAKKNNGGLEISSHEGQGTQVSIWLPSLNCNKSEHRQRPSFAGGGVEAREEVQQESEESQHKKDRILQIQ